MLYREAGQFKATYAQDQQIFPIRQDRIAFALLLAAAFIVVPLIANQYWLSAILTPFLILALATLGLNILTGYAGQLSLGTAAFMAVGAFMAYNFVLRMPWLGVIPSFILAGLCAAAVGIVFGLPSLRIKGFYLAVATLACQFFVLWAIQRIGWITNYSASGVITAHKIEIFAYAFDTPVRKYLLTLAIVAVMALLAKNLMRSETGRAFMAVRDMDVAAEVIGIRPLRAKLSAFAVSSFFVGVAGALWAFVYLGSWEPLAFDVNRGDLIILASQAAWITYSLYSRAAASTLPAVWVMAGALFAYTYLGTVEPEAFTLDLSFRILFMVIIGGVGSILGSFLGAGFITLLPIFLSVLFGGISHATGMEISHAVVSNLEQIIFGGMIIFFLVVEPHGLARLWQIAKEKLRLWPFPH